MKKIAVALFLIIGSSLLSQNLKRQIISSQGNSIAISNGMFVSQSIGQQYNFKYRSIKKLV